MNTETQTERTSPVKFVRQVKQEAKKVTWPSRKETVTSTIVVIVMVIIAALFFLLVDFLASGAIRAILES